MTASIRRNFALLAAGLLASAAASAANLSFTGAFTQDDDVQLFNFTVGAPSTVTLRTWSYAGGVNAAGQTIARGGFDPILALFSGTGAFIGQNDDGGSSVPVDLSGVRYDTYLSVALNPGSYTVSVMQFDNFAIGPNLSNGFSRTGQGNFTGSGSFSSRCAGRVQFCDVSGNLNYNQRNGNWAFDILNVESAEVVVPRVPEPATLALLGLGLLGVAAGRRKR